jgi:hypothetical protein
VGYRYGSGSSITLYQDGRALSGSWVAGTGNGSEQTSTGDLWIGKQDVGGFAHPFGGLIADVRLYDRILSPQEIWRMWDPATRWELYRPPRRTRAMNSPAEVPYGWNIRRPDFYVPRTQVVAY